MNVFLSNYFKIILFYRIQCSLIRICRKLLKEILNVSCGIKRFRFLTG